MCEVEHIVPAREKFFIDNLLVRIHFIIVMIRWIGLAPRVPATHAFGFQVSLSGHPTQVVSPEFWVLGFRVLSPGFWVSDPGFGVHARSEASPFRFFRFFEHPT